MPTTKCEHKSSVCKCQYYIGDNSRHIKDLVTITHWLRVKHLDTICKVQKLEAQRNRAMNVYFAEKILCYLKYITVEEAFILALSVTKQYNNN